MLKDPFYKGAFKAFVFIVLYIAASRFTYGAVPLLLVLAGCVAAFNGKSGRAICCYMLLPFTINISSAILPKSGPLWPITLRFGTMALAIALCFSASKRQGSNRLPFFGIVPFLMSACVGSATGWLPMVSYMKLVNYFVFLLGVWVGTQNLQERPKDLALLRTTLFAMTAFVILGSLAVRPFPSISYATSLGYAMAEGGAAAATAAFHAMAQAGEKVLFCGVMNHSQALSPILALSFAWLLCDMLFVEKRLRLPHVALILLAMPMLYMTRSRVAFVTIVSAFAMIYFYAIRKIRVAPAVKRKLGLAMTVFIAVSVAVMAVLEVRNDALSKWLRKTQDVDGDAAKHSLAESMTASRQSLIEYSMYEYRRNPLFGSGFQVAIYNREALKNQSFVLSASIEKGVLPVMVLGETGIVGAVLFAIFLISFYATATRRRLYVTITMFTLLLATNMGEATFFSPGGIGAVLWILTVCGGFVIDTILLYERRMRSFAVSPKPNGRMPHRGYSLTTNCREVYRA